MIDACYRAGFRLAYGAARLWWRLVPGRSRGALVALWHDGRVLLVRNSYLAFLSLPGGHLGRAETPLDGAVREAAEEVGIALDAATLRLACAEEQRLFRHANHVTIFEAVLPAPPEIRIDNREVVAAEFLDPAEALARPLFPPLRRYLEQRRN